MQHPASSRDVVELTADLAVLGCAAGLVTLDMAVRAVRFRLLLPRPARPSLARAALVNAYGEVAAAVTPARLGGEPARILGFRRAGVPPAISLGALAAEIAIGWVLILGACAAFALALPEAGRALGRRIADTLASGTWTPWLSLTAAILVASAVAARTLRNHRNARGARFLEEALASFRRTPPHALLAAAALTAASVLARVAILPVLLLPLGPAIPAGQVFLASFVLLHAQLLLPSPSGAGAVELGFLAGLAGTASYARLGAVLLLWRLWTLGPPAVLVGVHALRSASVRRNATRWAARAALLIALSALATGTLSAQHTAVKASSLSSPTDPLTHSPTDPLTRPPTDPLARGGEASRKLPVDHPAHEYIDRLRRRGHLRDLNPLVQPVRRLDVARALAALDPDTMQPPAADWVRWLQREFRHDLDRLAERRAEGPAWGVELTPGVRASTSRRLDPLRPLGDAGVWPRYDLSAWVETGALAAETGLTGDLYFRDDPDGLNPDQRRGGRPDNAYLAVALPFGEISLGRYRRNWGPAGTPGLMVSSAATSYPQLALELRAGRLALRSFTGELDTIRGEQRYLAAHRLDYESPNLILSFGEAILYAGGAESPSLRYLNPLAFLFFDHDKRPDHTLNLVLDGQIWYRSRGTTLYGEFLLDDVETFDAGKDREPLQYAFAAAARFTSLAPWLEPALEYRQVGAWTYRTVQGIDRYSYLLRGLGENYADFDRLTLSLDVFPPVPGLRLSPTLQLQRQGEGDIRGPDPVLPDYLDEPAIFLGVKETTLRAGLGGRYSPGPHLWIEWQVGYNLVRDADHVAGRSRSALEAVAAVGISLPFRLRGARATSGSAGGRSAST